jgi:hypothetical protein
VVEVAAEKNSTLVLPFPIELLRFFDRAGSATPSAPAPAPAPAEAPPAPTPAQVEPADPPREVAAAERAELPKAARPQIPDPRTSED